MAENKQPDEIPEIPDVEEEVDLVFKAEMKVRDLLLGYWKHALVIVGAGLMVSLVVGLYFNYVTSSLRDGSESMAKIDAEQPEIDQMALMGLAPMDDPADTERMAILEGLAKRYEEAAANTTGASAGAALLKAAETWQRVGKTDELKRVYQTLSGMEGLYATAGRNGLAAVMMYDGDMNGAVALLRVVADTEDGLYAERALLEILRIEQGRDNSKAAQIMEEFKLRFPNSPRLDELALTASPTAPPTAPAVPPTVPAGSPNDG